MTKTIVIASVASDQHAFAVREALRDKGAQVVLWYTADFPTRSRESIRFSRQRQQVTFVGPEETRKLGAPHAVWHRRVGRNQDFGGLHPADVRFAANERAHFREGALAAAFRRSFHVNPWGAGTQAENKVYQQAVAHELGLRMPDSLVSNDPKAIRRFLRQQGGEMIYKPLLGSGWFDGEKTWACHTVALTEEDLVEDHLLALTPGIYQALIPKAFELRITMVGQHAFAAKILSQDTEHGRIDWRRGYSELDMEPIEVDAALTQQCINLMEALGLVFGCFDFIVTPDGETIFLEVNQMGQFLFVEQRTGLPILDAFTELLLQARPDFGWRETSTTLRYRDFAERAAVLSQASLAFHIGPPAPVANEAPDAVASEPET